MAHVAYMEIVRRVRFWAL